MSKAQVEKFLAYFSASFGLLSAFIGFFLLGFAVITAGQRVPYGAAITCVNSAFLLALIAASLFRKRRHARNPALAGAC